jgi:hypothetical protein
MKIDRQELIRQKNEIKATLIELEKQIARHPDTIKEAFKYYCFRLRRIYEIARKYNGLYLTRNTNNFFGIKAYSSWKGEKYLISTREERPDGSSYYIKSYFRKYPSVQESIKDYLKLITNNHYIKAGVTVAPSVKEQFKALKRGGYFTANAYVDLATNVYNGMKADIDAIPDPQPAKKIRNVILIVALVGGFVYTVTQPKIKTKIKNLLYV